MRILLLDNHDSFTYNLAELLRRNGKADFSVFASDRISIREASGFDKIIFSPGPGLPEEQPAMFDLLREFADKKPILGICLGMQAIAVFYGGELFNMHQVVHGQPKKLNIIRPHYMFKDLLADDVVGLYHSWAVSEHSLPACLETTAYSEDGIIMGLCHRDLDVCGLQFHPESVITRSGQAMMDCWIAH